MKSEIRSSSARINDEPDLRRAPPSAMAVVKSSRT